MSYKREPKIYFKGEITVQEETYFHEILEGYMEKIAIDYSARKIRGTLLTRWVVNGVSKPIKKTVYWWSFDDELLIEVEDEE